MTSHKSILATALFILIATGAAISTWHYRKEQVIKMYVHTGESWHTNLFKGKAVSLSAGDDPTCTFKLTQLIDRVSDVFELKIITEKLSWPSLTFNSHCNMGGSIFYKYKVTDVIWVSLCFQPNIVCHSKVFEISRPIDEKAMSRAIPVILEEMYINGASDRQRRIP